MNVMRVHPRARRSISELAKLVGIHPRYAEVVLRHLEVLGKIKRRGRPGPNALPEIQILEDGFVQPMSASALPPPKPPARAPAPVDPELRRALSLLMRSVDARHNISLFSWMLGYENHHQGRSLLNRLAARNKIVFRNRGLPRMRVVVIDPYFD